MPPEQKHPDRRRSKRAAWIKYWIIFTPLLILALLLLEWFDPKIVLPSLWAIAVLTMLHQRYIKERTWNSILWGIAGNRSVARTDEYAVGCAAIGRCNGAR